MVGIILVSHGKLASQLLAVSGLVLGEMDGIEAVDLDPSEGSEDLERKVRQAYQRRNEGAGVLALVDIVGGTPGNVCALLSNELEMKVVAGMNLPMLIKALTSRGDKLAKLAGEVAKAGGKGCEELNG